MKEEQKMYTIIEDNIKVGFFQNRVDRDKAFDEYVLPRSDNCMKAD